MNLRALRVFVGLMDDGTLTRSATRMNLSQSAASRLLSVLEGQLGTPLFVREKRRMLPTSAADALYPEAVRILGQVGALPELVARASVPPPLRVICQTRLVPGLAVPSIARFAEARPGHRVRLESAPRRELARRLLAGRHDVAIATVPFPIEGIDTTPLGTLRLGFLMRNDHPLAERSGLRAADLAGMPYIALDESTVVRRMVDGMSQAVLPTPTIEVSTGSAAYRLVAEGLGFTIADPLAVDPELWSRLSLVPWHGAPELTVAAARMGRDTASGSEADRFIELVGGLVRSAPPTAL